MKRKPAPKTKTLTSGESITRAIKTRSTAATIARPPPQGFREVLALIERARQRAFHAVNTELIDLYWQVGEFICSRIASDGWGKSTIVSLAAYIRRREPNARGFSAQNLWRMRQFYETWSGEKKLSALLRELSWTNNLLIMGKCKRSEEREFYLRLATHEKWPSRQLERQIDSALFERVALSPAKLSAPLRVLHPQAADIFKDAYVVEFLQLPAGHLEADLHRGLLAKLKQFLIELGRDFCFVGSEYSIQVGGRDFALDLLFFHRGLNCLVAFDLKVTRFEPEHLGKMEFYLEALDRDVHPVRYLNHEPILLRLCSSQPRGQTILRWLHPRLENPRRAAQRRKSFIYQWSRPARPCLLRSLSQPTRRDEAREVSQDGLGKTIHQDAHRWLSHGVNKPHERPSIGVLLCATKDNEVVEYSLSRSLSPALIAEYQTALPDKQLLQRKLHEFYQLALPATEAPKAKPRKLRRP